MRYALVSSIFLLLAVACKQTTLPAPSLNGTYTGTFQRQSGGSGQISQVSIVFSNGKWTGTSQTPKYPALCNGTYQINGINRILFTNSCFWTADFDWSLILSQQYELNMIGNDVKMVRTTSLYQDVYTLTK